MSRCYLLVFAVLFAACCLAQEKPETPKKEPPKDGNELLIKPARTLEFTTDEGTWMSLDLSPDGQTIVFEMLGDLYTLPAAGGAAKRIVGGMHFDMMPRFSPDGKKIAFVSDRSGGENLWLVDADGTNPKALTTGRKNAYTSPSWSPDGHYVVASKSDGGLAVFRLMMVDVRGGSGMAAGPKVADPARRGTNRMGAIFSPDGRFMYYAERQGLWTYDSKFPLWQIRRYDRQTGDVATITNALGSAMRPMLSPDGKTLVYATRFRTGTALRARNLTTGDERWVAYPIDRDNQEAIATEDTIAAFAFTKDGKSLIMPLHGKIQKLDLATGKAAVIPFTAAVKVETGKPVHYEYRVDESPTVKARIIRDASLSPDGSKLVFTAFNRIYVMAYPGGAPARLTKDEIGEFQPTWSPDGKSIAYVTWSERGGHICKADATSGKSIHLTAYAGFYGAPVFTGDGKTIAYMASPTQDGIRSSYLQHTYCFGVEETELGNIGPAGPADIYTVSSQGGMPTFVTSSAGYGSLQTSKEPNRLYMVGAGGLSSIRLDGLDKRELIKVNSTAISSFGPGAPIGADEIRISHDGSSAFVSVQNQIYLTTLPMLGGIPIEITLGAGPAAIPAKKITPEGGDNLNWSADGKCVTWTLGDKFYCQKIDADKPEVTAINVEMPRHKARGTLVLKNARIITMKGDTVIPRGDVVVTDSRITYVGPTAANPAGATVIDCTGKTISPGYVDVHSHWFGGNPKLAQSWGYLANLAYGVTTNRDPQSGSSDIYDYSDMIEVGQAIGPRIYTTGPGVFSDSGLGDMDSTKNFVKRYAEAYKTNTLKEYMTGDRMTRQQVLLACDQYRITPTCEGGLDFKLNMTQIVDGFSGHEHSLPIMPIYNDVVQLVTKMNTFYTPTLLVNYGAPTGEDYWFEHFSPANDAKLRRFVPDELLDTMVRRRANWVMPEEYSFSKIAEGCAKVVRNGGKVCLGSHGQLQGLGAHWEMWSLASGGMKPIEVLRCATINGAEAIGLAQDIGSVEKGKLADLVIYDKNPLDDIRNTNTIRFVIRGGDVFEGNTMDQVWPVKKKLGPIYYQNAGPTQTIRQ